MMVYGNGSDGGSGDGCERGGGDSYGGVMVVLVRKCRLTQNTFGFTRNLRCGSLFQMLL